MNPNQEPEVEEIDELESIPDSVSEIVPDDRVAVKPTEKPDDKPKQEAPKPYQDLSKLHNTIAYQTRQLDKAMRELADMKTQLASRPAPVIQNPNDPDFDPELNKIAETNWQRGVKKLVEKDIEAKVQEILSKREAAIKEVQTRTAMESELEKSKQRVFQRYPEIEDTSTEEAQLYRDVINEDNSLLSNIHGPEIAMYRMEEKIRQSGRVPSSIQPAVSREAQRLARVGASSVIGRTAGTRKNSELTKDQKEFCKHHNISEESYKANLRSNDPRGGVEA